MDGLLQAPIDLAGVRPMTHLGAKAASHADTFMTSIQWQNADRLFEHLAV
jgi:hypothetical protein